MWRGPGNCFCSFLSAHLAFFQTHGGLKSKEPHDDEEETIWLRIEWCLGCKDHLTPRAMNCFPCVMFFNYSCSAGSQDTEKEVWKKQMPLTSIQRGKCQSQKRLITSKVPPQACSYAAQASPSLQFRGLKDTLSWKGQGTGIKPIYKIPKTTQKHQ